MVEGKQYLSGSLVEQLAAGTAWFEFVETPVSERSLSRFPSISAPFPGGCQKMIVSPCFARMGRTPDLFKASQQTSSALKETPTYTVHKIAGDGRCIFRALVQGMAANKGTNLSYVEEGHEAENLRIALMDAICRDKKPSSKYKKALIAIISAQKTLDSYCESIPKSDFSAGQAELLILSRVCELPIIVYKAEAKIQSTGESGYTQIGEYGSEFKEPGNGREAREPVRLLFSGKDHYDLLK